MTRPAREIRAPAGALTLLGPLLTSSAYVLEIALVPLLLPALRAEAGLSVQDLTLVVNVYAVAVAAGVLICGVYGDRLGPVRTFVVGAAIFLAGSLGTALSGSLETILPSRFLQGLGGGIFSPVVPILLAQIGGARPGRFLSLWNSFSGLLLAAAPLLVLPLLVLFGWQAVFVVLAVLVAPALLLVRRAVPPQPEAGPPPRGSAAGLLKSVGRMLANPTSTLLIAYVGLTYGTAVLFLFTLPLILSEGGETTLRTAWTLGAFWVCFTVTGLLQSSIIDGRLARALLTASPLMMLSGFMMFLYGSGPVAQIAAAAVVGSGFALGNATSTMLILRHAPPGATATAASLDITFARLGSVATVALFAALPAPGLAAGVAALSLAAAVMASFVRRMPRPASAPPEIS